MTSNYIPIDYSVPPFPSLYKFLHLSPGQASYLYNTTDIWRFTLFWTLILFGGIHLIAGLIAMAMQPHNWRLVWITPVAYLLIGGLEALLAGSVVGLLHVSPTLAAAVIYPDIYRS